MLRKKALWIALLALALLGVGGYAAYAAGWTGWLASQESAVGSTLQTAAVTVGDISITADGTGVLVASSEANLAFGSTGTLMELLVEVGDVVEAGEVLAWIDDTDARQNLVDAEGFRGTYDPAFRDGKVVSAEWNWHGQTEAEFAALLLAPGEEWPFSVEITAQDMASFLIHPDATATGRESVPVELSEVRLVDEGTAYVRVSGTATNASAFKVKNVTVAGVLLDQSGQIVSLGSVYVLRDDIAPGESVSFDVHVESEPYADYQLYAQAERDWDE